MSKVDARFRCTSNAPDPLGSGAHHVELAPVALADPGTTTTLSRHTALSSLSLTIFNEDERDSFEVGALYALSFERLDDEAEAEVEAAPGQGFDVDADAPAPEGQGDVSEGEA